MAELAKINYKEKIELLKSIENNIDKSWSDLNKFEKKFIEDILEKFKQYGGEIYVSVKQLEILLEIASKIL